MPQALSDKQWDTFFDLLDKIVKNEDLAAIEKRDEFVSKAKECGSEKECSEFFSWQWEYVDFGE